MAINKKLKLLLKHATEIISFYEKDHSSTYTISPYVDPYEGGSEVVTIYISADLEDGLKWEFLEPLSNYCISKNLAWKIFTQDDKYVIEIQN